MQQIGGECRMDCVRGGRGGNLPLGEENRSWDSNQWRGPWGGKGTSQI